MRENLTRTTGEGETSQCQYRWSADSVRDRIVIQHVADRVARRWTSHSTLPRTLAP